MGDPIGTLCIHKHQIYQELGLVSLDFLLDTEITWGLFRKKPLTAIDLGHRPVSGPKTVLWTLRAPVSLLL